ncbi:MAG: hypothetical protein MPJ78_15355 [Hyphomicrobiaceae bacterium]|nr:hypothetical protein [Hyphomicrobiaceae bacterium]
MTKKLLRVMCAGVVGLGLGLSSGTIPLAAAQTTAAPEAKAPAEKSTKKKPSDRTVRVIMGYAFAALPDSVPKRNGEVVQLEREKQPEKFMIPIEDARRIIRHASLSARADLCGLKDLERKHYGNMMKHEQRVKKWTSYQVLFIDLLHTTTGLVMTGSVQTGDDAKKADDASKDVRSEYVCSPQERERIKAAVEADIKALASGQ